MVKKVLHTKYGTARINKHGYYVITSYKEGNGGKLLHRLIYEEHRGEIPNGYVIHHIDENKLNNDVNNLLAILLDEHLTLHHRNKIISEESKEKMSESKKGNKNPRWKNYARIVKSRFNRGKQTYNLKYNGKVLKNSTYMHKLINWFNENYPTEPLHIQLNGGK